MPEERGRLRPAGRVLARSATHPNPNPAKQRAAPLGQEALRPRGAPRGAAGVTLLIIRMLVAPERQLCHSMDSGRANAA